MPENHLFFLVEQQRRMLGIKNVELNDGKQVINYIKPSPTQISIQFKPKLSKHGNLVEILLRSLC